MRNGPRCTLPGSTTRSGCSPTSFPDRPNLVARGPSTDRLFEQEANRGAAELLFQRHGFTQDARSLDIGIV
jgi:hypothetical protein